MPAPERSEGTAAAFCRSSEHSEIAIRWFWANLQLLFSPSSSRRSGSDHRAHLILDTANALELLLQAPNPAGFGGEFGESKCCPFTGAVPFLPSLISGYPCHGQESGCSSPGAFPLLWGHTWGGGFKAQDWCQCKTEAMHHGGDGRGQCQALICAATGFGDWTLTLGWAGPVDLYLQNADPRTDVARVRVCFLFCSALRQEEDVWSAHGGAAGAHKCTENPARSLTGFSGVSLTCGSVELSETLQ